jgi:hypothetical protein
MLVSLGATKMMAERLMQEFPQHATACQAIVDLAADGEADIRGTIAQLDQEQVDAGFSAAPDRVPGDRRLRQRWRGAISGA